jgi:hypothetical protein
VNFRDIVVSVGGNALLATSADLQLSYPYDGIESLGAQGTPFSSDQRENGTLSISYYLQESDSAIRDLIADGNPITPVICKVGQFKVDDALLTSYSLSLKPFSLIEAQVSFSFFTHINSESADTITPDPLTALINGAASSITYSNNFNNKFISCDLNITQEFDPIYNFGDPSPTAYARTNGEINVKIEGDGLPSIITWPCPTDQSVTLSLASVCGALESLTYSNLTVKNMSATAQVGETVNGSVELYKLF